LKRSEKIRLDQLLVDRELYPSRSRAQSAILEGKVLVNGMKDVKAGDRVKLDARIELLEPDCPYVSRGGLKLAGALDRFGIDVNGFTALDIGASTGGFTDCLLKRGASHVTALDVGKGLIAWPLRTDERVAVIENINARNMPDDIARGPFDIIAIDVSFISLKLIFPNLPSRLNSSGSILALIKPQFEAGREKVGRGIVKDSRVWTEVLQSFVQPEIFNTENPPVLKGFAVSPIEGREGNREFFGLWKMGAEESDLDLISGMIAGITVD